MTMSSRYGNTHKKLQELRKYYDNEWSQHFWNEFIFKNINNIKWYILSKNLNITCDIVQVNLDKPWDYYWLSSNKIITWDIVQANPDKPWDYDKLSKNQILLGISWKQILINLGIINNYHQIQILLGILFKQIQINHGIVLFIRKIYLGYRSRQSR